MNTANLEKIKNNPYVKELVECFVKNGITSVTTDTTLFPDDIDGEIMLHVNMNVKDFEKLVSCNLPWYDIEEGSNNIFVGWYGEPFPDELVGVMEG